MSIPDCLVGPAALSASLLFLITAMSVLILVALGIDFDVEAKKMQDRFRILVSAQSQPQNQESDAEVGPAAPKRTKRKAGRKSKRKAPENVPLEKAEVEDGSFDLDDCLWLAPGSSDKVVEHFIGEAPSDISKMHVHASGASPIGDEDVYDLDDSAWRLLSGIV